MKFLQGFKRTDLGGEWKFVFSANRISASTHHELMECGLGIYNADVPGNFEIDLYQNGIIPDPYFGSNIKVLREYERMYVSYFREFIYEPVTGCEPCLVFEGIDCIADVYINGRLFMSTDNMMISHRSHAADFLTHGTNEIIVNITPPGIKALDYEYPAAVSGFHANYESLYIRKPAHMFGWDILPRLISAGIFRPVYIEYLTPTTFTEAYLQTSKISEDGAESVFFYKCNFDKKPKDVWSIELSGSCKDSSFKEEFILSFQYGKHIFKIEEPMLWNPRGSGDPDLYDIKAILKKNGSSSAEISFTHGIRTIQLLREPAAENHIGNFSFVVNGKEAFIKGTNWVPADALHSRDYKRIPKILEMAADLNCNMIRCWGGNLYENDLFYEICDREGIMIWQDFAMACAVYPQDIDFQKRLYEEASEVIKRLRQHPCLALWAGDNECDQAYSWFGFDTDPNTNGLTRSVLPEAVRMHDPFRDYLPSSPYIESTAWNKGDSYLPENHLWGIRDYYKSSYYKDSTCRFASEMGYHGCPSPASIRKFISAGCIWPYDNEEWLLHSTSPLPEIDKRYNFRVQLMANQIEVLFGFIPDNIEDFSLASQISQAEAKKFFIELFRGGKWERTGIIWWNLMDGWPQFSDAIVDYYFNRKLAYEYIKRSQEDVFLMIREPSGGNLEIIACNDTPRTLEIKYEIIDTDTDVTVYSGVKTSAADRVTPFGKLPYSKDDQKFYIISWDSNGKKGINHYLAGTPPFDFNWYKEKARRLSE